MFKHPLLRSIGIAILLAGGVIHTPTNAAVVSLYSGNGLPSSETWLAYADNALVSGGTANQTIVPGGVTLSTSTAVSAGYSNYFGLVSKNPLFPTLDRSSGFELQFSAQIHAENHNNMHRSGFSVILLDNQRRGIELGFWADEIWAQSSSPIFTHAEGVAFDTSIQRDYRLTIQDNRYLLSDGSGQLLEGALRDYTAFGNPPYVLPNFLFLGDNTSSASANATIGPILLRTNLAAVPEPASQVWVGLASIVLATRRRRTP